MRLLNLVQEDEAARATPDSLGELTALSVTDESCMKGAIE